MSCPSVSLVWRSVLVAAVCSVGIYGCGVDRSYSGNGPLPTPDMGGTGTGKCPAGQTTCSNKCIDPKVDGKNCGKCGNTCAPGETCAGGNCGCAGGPRCSGDQTCCAMTGCKSLMATDANNCGTCGNSCDAANMGETCFSGKCGCGMADAHCTNGQACCNAACTDITTDAMNCGACGNTCAMGQTCAMSACTGGMMGGACKVNTDCPMGQQCLAGMCLGGMGGGCMPACMAPTMCLPGFGCFGCKKDADCPMGQKCNFIICK